MSKVFISYAHEDIAMAKKICDDLSRFGIDIWVDFDVLLPGQKWKDRIEDAIENSAYFIFLLSKQSLNKRGFVQRELNFALEILKEIPDGKEFIIPVRIENCEPMNRMLRDIQWVDLFPEKAYGDGLRKILKVIKFDRFVFRKEPTYLSSIEATEMIRKYGFYDRGRNNGGMGIYHQYERVMIDGIDGNEVIMDYSTGLMWPRFKFQVQQKNC